jgi:hypothetical protein
MCIRTEKERGNEQEQGKDDQARLHVFSGLRVA